MRRTWVHATGLALVVACAANELPRKPQHDLDEPTAAPVPVPLPVTVPVAPVASTPIAEPPSVLGAGSRSFLIKDEEYVLAAPDRESSELGYLTARTRVGVRALGPEVAGCRWLEIEPRGWICARGEPSPLAPSTEVSPPLWVRGYDGRVFRDAADVRADGGYVPAKVPRVERPWPKTTIQIDRRHFFRTVDGELVPAWAVPRYWGDEFTGVALDAISLPLAWTWFHETYEKPTPVRAEPSRSAKIVRRLPLRTTVSVLAETDRWIRIGDGEWIAREDLRLARAAAPPPEVTGEHEVWVDVVLAEQALVLYRGKTPILATLVATGRPKHGTPTGIFRIQKKTTVTEFRSPRPDIIDYHIKDVAWAMHLNDIYAIHGAWWTRGFGANTSLGCVDMPAADIRTVFDHVEPRTVPGWWRTNATPEHPGSVVRIRQL